MVTDLIIGFQLKASSIDHSYEVPPPSLISTGLSSLGESGPKVAPG